MTKDTKINGKGQYWCKSCGKWVATYTTGGGDEESQHYEVECAECGELLAED
jgi:ribosomal protein S27E